MRRTILVTGGAGFIGSNFVLQLDCGRATASSTSTNSPTPATPAISASIDTDPGYIFVRGDIEDAELVAVAAAATIAPEAVVQLRRRKPRRPHHRQSRGLHLAPTSLEPSACCMQRLPTTATLSSEAPARFRFLHVSTDEVYGSLGPDEPAFTETTPYAPIAPIRPARPPATTSCAPIITPTACRRSSPTAPTTTGPSSFPKSSSR